jgi:hypothetical protein
VTRKPTRYFSRPECRGKKKHRRVCGDAWEMIDRIQMGAGRSWMLPAAREMLEDVLQGQLNLAFGRYGIGNLPERRTGYVIVRNSEAGGVQSIEDIRPEVEVLMFGDRECLA